MLFLILQGRKELISGDEEERERAILHNEEKENIKGSKGVDWLSMVFIRVFIYSFLFLGQSENSISQFSEF